MERTADRLIGSVDSNLKYADVNSAKQRNHCDAIPKNQIPDDVIAQFASTTNCGSSTGCGLSSDDNQDISDSFHTKHKPYSGILKPTPDSRGTMTRELRYRDEFDVGYKNVDQVDDDSFVQTVEIVKRPGQTLGFYIREGNGFNRFTGVFISRIALGSVVEQTGVLKIGDEILSVDGVDVTRMSLEDVVVLMSIPKRLVLTVKTRKYCKNASCPSLSALEIASPPLRPVVVRKGRFSDQTSANSNVTEVADNIYTETNLKRSQDNPRKTLYHGSLSATSDDDSHHLHQHRQQRNVDDVDSTYSRRYLNTSRTDMQDRQRFNYWERTSTLDSTHPTYRSTNPMSVDYFSDSDAHYGESRATRRQERLGSAKTYRQPLPGGMLRHTNSYSATRYGEQRDNVINRTYYMPRSYQSNADQLMQQNSFLDQGELNADWDTSGALQHWLKKLDNLSTELNRQDINWTSAAEADRGQGCVSNMLPLPDDSYTSFEYQKWNNLRETAGLVDMRTSMPPASLGNAIYHTMRPSLSRKLSADALLESRVYKDELLASSGRPRGTLNHPGLKSSSVTFAAANPQGGFSKSNSDQVMSSTYNKPVLHNQSQELNSDLTKKPLQIKVEDFLPYAAETDDRRYRSSGDIDGLLYTHVYCGHGLKSAKMTLRDLYCVVSVDSVDKARTKIRTGAMNFDWDENFDIDLFRARCVRFFIYNWDPVAKQQLCYRAHVYLHALIHQGSRWRLALRLEPKGVLYLEFQYKEPRVVFERAVNSSASATFGVPLEKLMKAGGKQESAVPNLVVRCVETIEERGLEHVGLYRLCGSARRKYQLRNELESNPAAADLSDVNVPDINVVTSVLKDFFEELPEPLFTNTLYQMLLDAVSVRLPEDPTGSAKLVLNVLDCLPKANQDTLAFILNHIAKVLRKSEVNKVTSHSVAIYLGPSLLCPSADVLKGLKMPIDYKRQADVLSYLISIWSFLKDNNSIKARLLSSRNLDSDRSSLQGLAKSIEERHRKRTAIESSRRPHRQDTSDVESQIDSIQMQDTPC